MTGTTSPALDKVYAAKTPEELNASYREWASDYNQDVLRLGYHLPFTIGGFVARYVPKDEGPILDAGTGTGLTGLTLRTLGYRQIDGLDFSAEMIEIAGRTGVYRQLEQAELGKSLPFKTDHYGAVVSSGVFTKGHAPASGFDELIRVTRPGGLAIIMIRDTDGGEAFGDTMRALEGDRKWTLLEKSAPFRSFIVAEPDAMSQALVYRING